MNLIDKAINWLFGILVVIRVFPLFAFAFIWFEPDPYYTEVLKFTISILGVLCSTLILCFIIKTKSKKIRLFWAGLWLFAELTWLVHAIVILWATDFLNTYLISLGIMAIPFIIYKTKLCLHNSEQQKSLSL